MNDLEKRLLAAHTRDDRLALVSLYREAADNARDDTAEAFYLTHAYVFALEMGHEAAPALHKRLKQAGREE